MKVDCALEPRIMTLAATYHPKIYCRRKMAGPYDFYCIATYTFGVKQNRPGGTAQSTFMTRL